MTEIDPQKIKSFLVAPQDFIKGSGLGAAFHASLNYRIPLKWAAEGNEESEGNLLRDPRFDASTITALKSDIGVKFVRSLSSLEEFLVSFLKAKDQPYSSYVFGREDAQKILSIAYHVWAEKTDALKDDLKEYVKARKSVIRQTAKELDVGEILPLSPELIESVRQLGEKVEASKVENNDRSPQ